MKPDEGAVRARAIALPMASPSHPLPQLSEDHDMPALTRDELRIVQCSLARLALSFGLFFYLLFHTSSHFPSLQRDPEGDIALVVDVTVAAPKGELTPNEVIVAPVAAEKLKAQVLEELNISKTSS